MAVIRVHLPVAGADRSYDVVCGSGILGRIGPALAAAGARRAAVIGDAAVAATHARHVAESLAKAGIVVAAIDVPSGESEKSVAGAERLWNTLADQAVDRDTHVVAVGGGVVGDLAGFVAATFARGLPLWHVPTTLVAQVDSAVGGKTGVNLASGKNLVGAFWQPRGVFADIDTLTSLPRREFTSGLAEVVKYGMIADADLFAWLEAHAADLVGRRPELLATAVERSVAIKAAVVAADERETTGARAALNYGHTFAHAYETVAGYGTLLHGEAVAIGMARAARLARDLGRIPDDVVARQDRLIVACGLPLTVPTAAARPADLLAAMARDKKTVDGRLRFVLPDRIGRVDLVADVPPDDVLRALGG